MDPGPSDEGQGKPPHHAAGAYGFSRNEVRGLIVFGLIAGGWIIYQWFERRSQAVPPWVMEDVMIDQSSATDSVHTADSGVVNRQRFHGMERDDTADPGHTVVDVNTAGQYELIRLPGIGPALATRIIAEREKNGPFANLLDFQRVNGIGPKKATALAGWVRFSRNKTTPPDTADQEP